MQQEQISQLLESALEEVRKGDFVAQVAPDVVMRARELCEEEVPFSQLVEVVQRDPQLVAYLVKISNSAFFRRSVPIESVLAAINRLGFDNTRTVIMRYWVRSLYSKQTRIAKKWLGYIQHRSITGAAYASVFARYLPATPILPERALLMGLVNDIGALPILQFMAEEEVEDKVLLAVIKRYAGKFGAYQLQQWGFDRGLVESVLQRDNWLRSRNVSTATIRGGMGSAERKGSHSDEFDGTDLLLLARYFVRYKHNAKQVPLNKFASYQRYLIKSTSMPIQDLLKISKVEALALIQILQS